MAPEGRTDALRDGGPCEHAGSDLVSRWSVGPDAALFHCRAPGCGRRWNEPPIGEHPGRA